MNRNRRDRHLALLEAMIAYLATLPGTKAYREALLAANPVFDEAASLTEGPGNLRAHDWGAMTSDAARPLVALLGEDDADLVWRRTYGDDPNAGPGFAERANSYGIIGYWAPLVSSSVCAGFMVVGPDVDYAEHAHEPDEIYAPLAGQALFRGEGYGEVLAGPGSVLEHRSWQWHSMTTMGSPVLILWVWIGAGFTSIPVFRNAGQAR